MTAEFLENDLKRPHTLVLTLLESLGKKERNVGVGGEAQLLSRFTYEKLSRLPLTSFFLLCNDWDLLSNCADATKDDPSCQKQRLGSLFLHFSPRHRGPR